MEVIHLITGKINPNRINGINKAVHEMATNQVLQGYAVQVWRITSHPRNDYPQRNFAARLFRSCAQPFVIDDQLKQALLEKRGHIVVHMHGGFIPVFFSIGRFLDRERIPFVITPHGSYNKGTMRENALWKKIYFRLLEKRLLDYASYIHLLGQSERQELGTIYRNRKSLTIPYGFSRPNHLPVQEKAGVFSVVYCGRLVRYSKGLDILLEGFALFNKRHPESQLILIGDGREKESLRDLCRDLGLHTSVVFKGSLFGEEKVRMLQEAHVYAHPSRTYGLPAMIVEAAALGLPCLVSEATNMGSFIDRFDAGYTMKDLAAGECCKGLGCLYDRIVAESEEKLLQYNAGVMIDTIFDWTRILRYFDEIYRQALGHMQLDQFDSQLVVV
jgi:glycosyltransferase involved in cell wall biosynthesis